MKKIKELSVSVTYKVGLSDLEVSDKIYSGLEKIEERGHWDESEFNVDDDILDAAEWISNNIKQEDCFSWEYEIDELESEVENE